MAKSCGGCRWAIFQDYGYSNYTVEGTNVICAGLYHPHSEFDHWYGEADELKYAELCSHFEEGEPFTMDVDGEWDRADMTDQQRETHDLYITKQMLVGRI